MLFLLFFSSFHAVSAGHRGVVVLFGDVNDIVLEEGLKFKNPLAEVVEIDVREQREELRLNTYTRDIQMADIGVVFTYSLNANNVNKLYREVGLDYRTKLITPILENSIKDIVGKWEAASLIEKSRRSYK